MTLTTIQLLCPEKLRKPAHKAMQHNKSSLVKSDLRGDQMQMYSKKFSQLRILVIFSSIKHVKQLVSQNFQERRHDTRAKSQTHSCTPAKL